MSAEADLAADPFVPATLDEEIELAALANALRLAKGFTLLFARCNQPRQRERLAAALREQLPEQTIQTIHFAQPISHLLDVLRERLPQPPSGPVFVSGLEFSLPRADTAATTSFIANLNATRNSFPEILPCPLVLWVPEYVLAAIMRGAPDFFSIRSGVYYFVATVQESSDVVEHLVFGEAWTVSDLPLAQKRERIAAIETLLEDYQALPPSQRDFHVEIRLLGRLGQLFIALGRWKRAEAYYQQCLELARGLRDSHMEEQALTNLSVIYINQRHWKKAIDVLNQSLQSRGHSSDSAVYGQALGNLGIVYSEQGQLAKAEDCYRQSLKAFQRSQDRPSEAQTYGNIGNLYARQERWQEAAQAYQKSLEVFQEINNDTGQRISLENVSMIYMIQGRWIEAENALQESLKIARRLGDHIGEGHTLFNIAVLWRAQGNPIKAINLAQEAVAVLETTEDEQSLAEVRNLAASLN